MYRRGTEVDLRYGLRILEGISNLRRSCGVLRPVQEQCQQCIVSQTYPSARKAEEKSILQLRLLSEDYSEILAQVIATLLTTPLIFLNKRSHPERSGFKPYKYDDDRPSQGDSESQGLEPYLRSALRRSDLLSYPLICPFRGCYVLFFYKVIYNFVICKLFFVAIT